MSRDEAWATFTASAADVLAVDAGKIVEGASFADDLDADSLTLAEFAMDLEEKFGVKIEDTELDGISTIGAAFELVLAKLG
jgi:acyl carrier protein